MLLLTVRMVHITMADSFTTGLMGMASPDGDLTLAGHNSLRSSSDAFSELLRHGRDRWHGPHVCLAAHSRL